MRSEVSQVRPRSSKWWTKLDWSFRLTRFGRFFLLYGPVPDQAFGDPNLTGWAYRTRLTNQCPPLLQQAWYLRNSQSSFHLHPNLASWSQSPESSLSQTMLMCTSPLVSFPQFGKLGSSMHQGWCTSSCKHVPNNFLVISSCKNTSVSI